MHILILADSVDNQKAGIHVYTKNLIKALLKTKHKFTFIHSKPNKFFKNTNHYIIPHPKGPGTENIRRFLKIPKLIKELKPDIVLEPGHIGPFRIPKSIKKVVVVHDLTPILFPKFHIKRNVIIHKLFLKRSLKKADLILTPSKNTKKDIKKLYKIRTPIKVIPLGIEKPQKTAKKPQIKQPYILYLGTIEPRKNLITLINAFTELKKEHKIPHKLVLAGELGWKTHKTMKKARKNKNIITTNYVTEAKKASLYKHAQIFVYPSFYEGFGLPPLEAMSYGVPVIASTGGSLKEVLRHKALLFKPTDKKKLKKLILKLAKKPKLREKLSKKGQKYSKKFTWKQTAEKTLKALSKT